MTRVELVQRAEEVWNEYGEEELVEYAPDRFCAPGGSAAVIKVRGWYTKY